MSNIYITEPNTEGKVLLHTTFGDIDVELWPQQAPKACRNFVQLCLEGYYDNTIFHRIIAGFMVQGGDPTGTGSGGESIYGGAFIDEFHSRLRFNHRGIVAMANENAPNSNHSQFFFTLDACEFLEKKHTIFGKITGNTIFNVLSVGDVETDAQDRPLHPPKLLSVEVLWNPFDDIVPRDIKHKSATADAAKPKTKKRERKATNDLKLLSFGDDEQAFQQEVRETSGAKRSKKLMSSHDLLDDKKLKAKVDDTLLQTIAASAATDASTAADANGPDARAAAAKKEAVRASLKAAVAAAAAGKRPAAAPADDSASVAETRTTEDDPDAAARRRRDAKRASKAAASAEQDEYARLREELRSTKKAAVVRLDTAAPVDDMLTPLQQQRQKYLQQKRASSRSGRQAATLQKLQQFKATLEGANRTKRTGDDGEDGDAAAKRATQDAYHGQVLDSDSDTGEQDADDAAGDKAAKTPDLSWMTAKLKFKKHIDDQFRAGFDPSADNYTTIDSRDERGSGKSSSDSRSRGRSRSRDRERHHSSSSRTRRY